MAVEKNLARFLSVNFVRLVREVLVAFPRSGFDLDQTVKRLRDAIWGDDLTAEEKRALLFGTKAWDNLPMAVLAARYLTLPTDRIPGTREDLFALCRWLMSRGGDDTLIDTCVRGWARTATPFDALKGFIDELWDVQYEDPAFFAAVVRGQHQMALEMIVERRLSPALDDDLAISILTRMALIWAAFDCQATTARARRSMTKPLGWLINGDAVRMRADTLIAVFRPVDAALRKFLDGYTAQEDATVTRAKPRSRLLAVMDIRARAKDHASHLDATQGAFALDAVLKEVVARSTQSDDPFLEQVGKGKTDRAFGKRQMSQFWYGLLPIHIVGLAAMRLAQMEQQLQTLLHDAVAQARRAGIKPQVMVPDFHDIPLRPGWKRRSRSLTDALRGAVLHDADRHATRKARARAAGSDEMWKGAANDDQFIDAVQLFLDQTGRYGPVTGRATWADKRRAFDDLDVAIGRRFDATPYFPIRLDPRFSE
ncbi:hypothetical protein [Sphingomonas faeni]|uniref:hypothetical protein n=1 Tax=Sphingomonas faeni TaxID=185950 RepID=UPI00334DB8D0